MSPTARSAKDSPETATDRLARLLTMVPWLVARQGIDLDRAAAELGITVEQLETDLRLLYLCGYGQMPDELIDAQWEDGRVFVSNADTIARPLRLGRDEALTLMVGLRALASVPGLGERDAVERAMAKLEEATGASGAAAARVEVSIDEGVEADLPGRRPGRASRDTAASTCATSCRAATRPPSATSTRCGSSTSTPGGTSRAGATSPQDTRLFRMDRIESLQRARRRRHPAAAGPAARPRRGGLHPASRGHRRDPAAAPGSDLGQRLLPGRLRRAAGRRLPARDPAHGRHAVAAPAHLAAGRAAARVVAPRGAGRRRRRGRPERAGGLRERPAGLPAARGRVGAVWWWVLIWVLLVVLAAAYLGARAWGVWGRLKELTREVSRVVRDRRRARDPGRPPQRAPPRPRPTSSATPAGCAGSGRRPAPPCAAQRRARLSARRPGWANHLDS